MEGHESGDGDEAQQAADKNIGEEGDIDADAEREKRQAKLDQEAKEIIAKKNNFFGKEVVKKLKELSREPIVFIKGMGSNMPIQWTTIVGDAYIEPSGKKVLIPIKIIGEPRKSRSLVVCYKMNLELLVIEKETL